MADENSVPAADGVEASDGVKAITVKKQRSPKRNKAEMVPAASKVAPVKTPSPLRRTFSDSEKAEKLDLIGKQVAKGKAPLKEAIKSAGISVPTYYQWKRSEKPAAKSVSGGGHELAELVQLEEENQRLRMLLAEKLKAENVELRKRLRLD